MLFNERNFEVKIQALLLLGVFVLVNAVVSPAEAQYKNGYRVGPINSAQHFSHVFKCLSADPTPILSRQRTR